MKAKEILKVSMAKGPFDLVQQYPIIEVYDGLDQNLGLTNAETNLGQLKASGIDIGGHDLYSMQWPDYIVFALKDGDEILTVLIGKPIPHFPTNQSNGAIEILRSWTPEKFRGKGYSPSLYDGLSRFGFSIVSDEYLSATAIRVWRKIQKLRTLKAYDMNTGIFVDDDPFQYNNLRIVLEQKKTERLLCLQDKIYYDR